MVCVVHGGLPLSCLVTECVARECSTGHTHTYIFLIYDQYMIKKGKSNTGKSMCIHCIYLSM